MCRINFNENKYTEFYFDWYLVVWTRNSVEDSGGIFFSFFESSFKVLHIALWDVAHPLTGQLYYTIGTR